MPFNLLHQGLVVLNLHLPHRLFLPLVLSLCLFLHHSFFLSRSVCNEHFVFAALFCWAWSSPWVLSRPMIRTPLTLITRGAAKQTAPLPLEPDMALKVSAFCVSSAFLFWCLFRHRASHSNVPFASVRDTWCISKEDSTVITAHSVPQHHTTNSLNKGCHINQPSGPVVRSGAWANGNSRTHWLTWALSPHSAGRDCVSRWIYFIMCQKIFTPAPLWHTIKQADKTTQPLSQLIHYV